MSDDSDLPEWYGGSYDQVPADRVLWRKAVPEWDAYFWISVHPAYTPPPAAPSWDKPRPASLRFNRGTGWQCLTSGSRSLELDHGVTPAHPLVEIEALGERLAEAALEGTRKFWEPRRAAQGDRRHAVIGREWYTFGSRTTPHEFNGFGGRWHRVVFHDGRVVDSCDLWHGGLIPPVLREEIPDSAVWGEHPSNVAMREVSRKVKERMAEQTARWRARDEMVERERRRGVTVRFPEEGIPARQRPATGRPSRPCEFCVVENPKWAEPATHRLKFDVDLTGDSFFDRDRHGLPGIFTETAEVCGWHATAGEREHLTPARVYRFRRV